MSARINRKFGFRLIMILMMLLLGTSSVITRTLPQDSYIVTGESLEMVVNLVKTHQGVITSELEIIDGVAAYLTPSTVEYLANHPAITYITPNATVEASSLPEQEYAIYYADETTPSADAPEVVGADYVWEQGVTGDGITIAIVDSGINPFNPITTDTENQTRLLGWKDFVEKNKQPVDPNGHGTHLASIMVNSQQGSDNSYNGIAPDANLVAVRVLDEQGYGSYETVIKGIQWVVNHQHQYDIKVLNLSLMGEVVAPYWADPLNQAVTKAWSKGITVIACAGNQGPDPMTVSVPGNNPYIITVGAFTDAYTPKDWTDDYLAEFSSAGPTQDAFIKPDLIAPGAHMVGLMAKDSYISENHEANRIDDSDYYQMAGTSQAAAVVSGIVALMYEQNPDLTPDEVKYRLMITAMPMIEGDVDPEEAKATYSVFQQGAGRINAPDAIFATEGVDGIANAGMDIKEDLKGKEHYQGFAYYDEETRMFGVTGAEDIDDGYSVWDGGYGIWSGGFGIWSGGFGIWSGGFGIWSGGFGIWSGGFGIWSGGFGIWSGGFGIWSGGFGIWSGGFGLWDESILQYDEELFMTTMSALNEDDVARKEEEESTPLTFDYIEGTMPDFDQLQIGVDHWVDD